MVMRFYNERVYREGIVFTIYIFEVTDESVFAKRLFCLNKK